MIKSIFKTQKLDIIHKLGSELNPGIFAPYGYILNGENIKKGGIIVYNQHKKIFEKTKCFKCVPSEIIDQLKIELDHSFKNFKGTVNLLEQVNGWKLDEIHYKSFGHFNKNTIINKPPKYTDNELEYYIKILKFNFYLNKKYYELYQKTHNKNPYVPRIDINPIHNRFNDIYYWSPNSYYYRNIHSKIYTHEDIIFMFDEQEYTIKFLTPLGYICCSITNEPLHIFTDFIKSNFRQNLVGKNLPKYCKYHFDINYNQDIEQFENINKKKWKQIRDYIFWRLSNDRDY